MRDAAGNPVAFFDETDSRHYKPEYFTGGLFAATADAQGNLTPAQVALNGHSISIDNIEGVQVAQAAITEDDAFEISVNGDRVLRLENADASPNIIGGSASNAVLAGAFGATIGGGGTASNIVTDNFGFIGGGDDNQAGNNNADLTDAQYATIAGGLDNTASGDRSVIAGGFTNTASDTFAAVGGGELNMATAEASTVSGGDNNEATEIEATVGGGGSNSASNIGATIGGGTNNIASGFLATVSGGQSNTASQQFAAVGGGSNNNASFDFATIAGGQNNTAVSLNATIGGGDGNSASAHAVVSGGVDNTASNSYAAIGGGQNNVVSVIYGTIAGGGPSDPANNPTTINNRVTDNYGSVGGGANNEAGDSNSQTASWFATVAGGANNDASALASFVGGGSSNVASGSSSAIAGGVGNIASGSGSFIGGGGSNQASALLGGATIGGGFGNIASGTQSTIPGGQNNTAAGERSFAAGFNANVLSNHGGAMLFSDNQNIDFDSAAANEFAVRATGGTRIVSAINIGTGAPTAGVQLSPGSGSWSSLSDRNVKANLSVVDNRQILELLSQIPIDTWNYKTQDTSIRHIGPMAQDFYAAFGVGEVDTRISTIDSDGVALAAIQGLYELVQIKETEIEALKQNIDAQYSANQEMIAGLQERLEALENESGANETIEPAAVEKSQSIFGSYMAWALLGLLPLSALLLDYRVRKTRQRQ